MRSLLPRVPGEGEFLKIAPGQLPRSWTTRRIAANGAITGWYVRTGDIETLATLCAGFRTAALRHGPEDLNGGDLDDRLRALTQAISGTDQHPHSAGWFRSGCFCQMVVRSLSSSPNGIRSRAGPRSGDRGYNSSQPSVTDREKTGSSGTVCAVDREIDTASTTTRPRSCTLQLIELHGTNSSCPDGGDLVDA